MAAEGLLVSVSLSRPSRPLSSHPSKTRNNIVFGRPRTLVHARDDARHGVSRIESSRLQEKRRAMEAKRAQGAGSRDPLARLPEALAAEVLSKLSLRHRTR